MMTKVICTKCKDQFDKLKNTYEGYEDIVECPYCHQLNSTLGE